MTGLKTSRIAPLAVALFAIGCGGSETDDLAATWDGGRISLAEVEASLRSDETAGTATRDEMSHLYRVTAEGMVISRVLLDDIDEIDTAAAEAGIRVEDLRRDTAIELFLRRELLPSAAVSKDDVSAFYTDHPALFHRPDRRFVSHIYRRHRDPDRPEETIDLLNDLRRRAQGGETFEQLAMEYSDSETRALGGRLGWIGRGRLPAALEDLVFSLDVGVVSEPVSGSDGALLFLVSRAEEERDYPLDDVRPQIRRRLIQLELDRLIRETLGDVETPEEALVLEPSEIMPRLQKSADDETILRIGSATVTAAEIRDQILETQVEEIEWIGLDEQIREIYSRQANRLLLALSPPLIGFAAEPRNDRAISERVESKVQSQLLEKRIEARLFDRIDTDSSALEQFYQDNAFLYQSPLRLRLETLSVPLSQTGGERTMAHLTDVHTKLQDGSLTMAAAATEMGGRVDDQGWLDAEKIAVLEPKVRNFILDLDGTGYTVPFQLNRELHVIRVAEREEPVVRTFADVDDRVRQDYFLRHQQRLYRDWIEDLLEDHRFRFYEANVLRALDANSRLPIQE